MPEGATLNLRLSSATQVQLDDLAGRTGRAADVLAAEAVDDYVKRELAIVRAIEAGLADFAAGNFKPHDEVFREIDALIDSIEASR